MLQPFKIAYIHNYFIPSRTANTVHATKMCQAFVQEGYYPTLFGFHPAKEQPNIQDLLFHYGIRDAYEFSLIRTYLRYHDFALRTAWKIKRQNFPLVFSRSLLGAMWTVLLGIPTIYEDHHPPGERLGQIYLNILYSRPKFLRLVVISEPLKQIHLKHYPKLMSNQVIIEPDAVDLERFENFPSPPMARLAHQLPAEQFTVGYAGQLYAGRGIELIVELAHRLPTLHFRVMGGEDSDIQQWHLKLQHNNIQNVELCGFVPNAQLTQYLATCDVLLMPYQKQVSIVGTSQSSHAWMSPMKMFEYMATQRLIISSDLPILRTVLNEQNAAFCKPDSIDEWEQAIRRAIEDSTWRFQLAYQARQDVEYYTWRKRVQRIMAHIEVKL